MKKIDDDIASVLYTPEFISMRVGELGSMISSDYDGKELILVAVLKGASVFAADLMRAISLPLVTDFIRVSSYGNETESSGNVRLVQDVSCDVSGKNVLIVEDIIDTGITLAFLRDKIFLPRGAASVKICTFLNKPSRRKVSISPDYSGFTVPDEFLVGYGLDYAEKYRNLPFVGILKSDIYR